MRKYAAGLMFAGMALFTAVTATVIHPVTVHAQGGGSVQYVAHPTNPNLSGIRVTFTGTVPYCRMVIKDSQGNVKFTGTYFSVPGQSRVGLNHLSYHGIANGTFTVIIYPGANNLSAPPVFTGTVMVP